LLLHRVEAVDCKANRVSARPDVDNGVASFSIGGDGRDFSINASLAASTFTPAITAPELSFTVPEIVLCAIAGGKQRIRLAKATRTYTADLSVVIDFSP
jgi:hypothetical protein